MSATSAQPARRCVTADVDLEALAEAYRHRPASESSLDHARRAATDLEAGDWALDVGGGPGEHAAEWAKAGINAVVVDPSAAMLAAAIRRRVVATVRGVGQQLPFRRQVFRLVYFHLSLHYGDWRRALDEAIRVLAAGGSCWVWTLGPDHHATSLLSQWFPSVAELDRRRFPDPDAIVARLAGWGTIERGKVRERRQRKSGEWREAVAAGFVSTLQLLEPGELEAGLQRFAEHYPDPEAPVTYEMRWDWIHLRRRPLP